MLPNKRGILVENNISFNQLQLKYPTSANLKKNCVTIWTHSRTFFWVLERSYANEGPWYLSFISFKLDQSLNMRWRLDLKSDRNHAHCKCLQNKDHIRDGLLCGFELFAFDKATASYHLKIWILVFCNLKFPTLSKIIWHYPCILFSLFAFFPGWLQPNAVTYINVAFLMFVSAFLLRSKSE